jgi:hypothetical protein
MATYHKLLYYDTLVAVSTRKTHLLTYLIQKGVRRLFAGISIIEVDGKSIDHYEYEDYVLEVHDTGFVGTWSDIRAFDVRKEADADMYHETLKCLEELLKSYDGKKAKHIEKTIELVKENKKKYIGKKHDFELMKEIVSIDFQTIVSEMQYMQDFPAFN